MKRNIMVGLALVIGFILVLILLLPVLLDMNPYRDRWVPVLEQALHRPVAVQEARLTIFPTFGIRLQDITIGDDPAFSQSPFATIPRTEVVVEFWPLLSRRIQLKKVVIHNPTVQVIRNRDGVFNTATIGKPPSAQLPEEGSSKPIESLKPLLGVFAVERFLITGGTLGYEDVTQVQSRSYQIDNLEMETNSVQIGQTASFDLKGMVMPLGQTFEMNGQFGPIQPTLDIPMIEVEAGLGKVEASAQGKVLSGKLELDVSVPHASTEDILLNYTLVKPVAVKKFHAHLIADLLHDGRQAPSSRVQVGPLALDIHSGGSVIHFSGNGTPLGLQLVGEAPLLSSQDFPVDLPIQHPFSLEHIYLETVIQGARVDVVSLEAKGFQGKIDAQGKWDGTLPVPLFSFQGKFMNFAVESIGRVIRSSSLGLTGTGELHWDVTGSLSSEPVPTLNGPILLRIHNGELTGFDVVQAIEEALQLHGLLKESNDATKFSLIEARADLEERDLIVRQFILDAPDFTVRGMGKIEFAHAVKFQGNLAVSQALGDQIIRRFPMSKAMRQNGQLVLPFTVHGTLKEPKLQLDTKSLGSQLKKDVERRIEKVLQGDEQELQRLLKDGEDLLKHFFGN